MYWYEYCVEFVDDEEDGVEIEEFEDVDWFEVCFF